MVTVERDSPTEFGIHIMHSKPPVISRVDAGLFFSCYPLSWSVVLKRLIYI